jgi:hypothetical protein
VLSGQLPSFLLVNTETGSPKSGIRSATFRSCGSFA